MRMQNEFDSFIEKKVGNYPSEIPDGLWEKMEARLDEEDGGGAAWWMNRQGWFGLLAVILAGGLIFNYVNYDSNEINGDSSEAIGQSAITYNGAAIKSLVDDKNLDGQTVRGDKSVESIGSSNNEAKKSITNGKSVLPPALEKPEDKKASYISEDMKKSAAAVARVDTKLKPKVKNANRNSIVSAARQVGDRSVQESIAVAGVPAEPAEVFGKEGLVLSEFDNNKMVHNEALREVSGVAASLESTGLAPLVPRATLLEYDEMKMSINDYSDGVLGCKTKKKRNGVFHLELLVSPDVAFRKLESKSEVNASHLADRDSTEHFSNAYTTAARIVYIAESGVMLRSGLQFSQITEKMDYTNDVEYTATITTATDTFSAPGLVPRYRVSWNRYKHIDIPLLVGYEMGDGPWRFNINGGVYVNIESWQRGQFMAPDSLDLVNFTTAQPNAYEAFRRNVGLSAYGSIAATYQFADKMHLVIEPHYRHFLKSHTIEDYGLDQRYKTFGVFAGVRFTL